MESDLYLEFIKQVNRLERQIDQDYHRTASYFGLSDCEMDIFYSFAVDSRPRTLRDLCEENYESKQTLSSALQGMKRKGWIACEPCAEDRRKKWITLTEAGAEKRKQTADRLLQLHEEAMEHPDPQKLEDLLTLLQDYSKNILERTDSLLHET